MLSEDAWLVPLLPAKSEEMLPMRIQGPQTIPNLGPILDVEATPIPKQIPMWSNPPLGPVKAYTPTPAPPGVLGFDEPWEWQMYLKQQGIPGTPLY